MKTLTLLRHAKSGWDDPVARDFDRPLNPKGHRAAQTMGRHMRGLGLAFDHVVASPAVRVKETLAEIEKGFGSELAPEWEKRLYLASAPTLLDIVQECDDAIDNLLFVGHNPGLEELVLLLVPGGSDLRSDVEEKFPTASLAQIRFDADSWRKVDGGTGTLLRFVRPRDLDPALGPDR
ncbi:SixA phosphatase family protein [Sphingosinithalassobacter portus]|uniref:SixA phosphatase family protein n=1 Tax=Stakelama portus TaxID=2676234 RepID=UPI000D6E6285|nr:histidine phosphatase family protein [Sphingosinithalassobacter portus]